ncbi:leucine-rich repeat receptor-like serine/threonine-protein kinase [Canna indica]|uniref:non-specific serine/threonine protein kinase n=1 Tax=Canna indica TaxID=4628 RepID=A0AAQ3KGV7_9LILI|nr:leucine-rich repeat receptor-like serine/threonine-protein kinase [Canna indica]
MGKFITWLLYYLLLGSMLSFMVAKCAIFLLLFLLQVVIAQDLPNFSLWPRQILHEKAALLAFKSTLTLQSQVALTNWNETTEVCEFVGVGCSRSNLHILRLELNRKLIAGPLSPVLANLTSLHELDLSENQLSGGIPKEFSKLRHLNILDLSGNYLSGAIPISLAYITNLGFLDLSNNSLVGQIPDSIFQNCTVLEVIDLSDNVLSGQIPSRLGIALPYLLVLNLYLNHFTGRLPNWLSNSSFLIQLDVGSNDLFGELPTKVIQDKSYLEVLHLSHNPLSSHDNNTNLEPFFLTLSNCSRLKELKMAGLGVGGSLPYSFGRGTTNLSIINLEDNRISGQLPPHMANFSKLTLLNLSNNLLNGSIPRDFCKLAKLEQLILSNNFLAGLIPSEIGSIMAMGLLDLSSNNLFGEIPRSIGNLVRLSELYLQKNQLSGSVPATLGRCLSLNKLDLSYNRLTGILPPEVSGIANIFFNLSNNQLQGLLPLELSKMDQVQEIDLSANNLTGKIIPQLSACVALRLINLSHNQLEGHLPTAFGDLNNLETLDVSFNGLTGEVPLSLIKCPSLTYLNLSYNDFYGPVPVGGVLASFNSLSYLGNQHLCGLVMNKTCPHGLRWLHSRKFLITVSVGASLAAFILTICCVSLIRKIKGMRIISRGDTFGTSSPMYSSHPRITYLELLAATEEFNQVRLIGSGSFGSVYRGTLRDGAIVAVKVLKLQNGNSMRSFKRECQVLKRIRHRNLMRIITACSLPDFKALVLPFMANGSLDDYLYSRDLCELSLVQRVNICSDVAEGMAYLHHHSPVKVIHCDLKPSNVLLNDEMTALVSDFGIARLVINAGVGSPVENMGSSTANMLCGSIGYIAPEYGYGSNASTKGDVYSFGVLMLEMVTRKRPTDDMFDEGMSLHNWVKKHHHDQVETVVDPLLASEMRSQVPEVKKMWEVAIGELLEIGLICTQDSPNSRPTMAEAAGDLDRLKNYLSGDTTATFASSLGMSSSTFGETSLSILGD